MLTQEDIQRYQERYHSEEDRYRRVSEYIMRQCIEYKRRYPKAVRVVFSREPVVKTFASIVNKIGDKRKAEDPNYTYDRLPDIIALTVLCPYRTDVDDFILWLKKSFHVHTPDEQALRHDPRGHRGWHYVVSVREEVLRSHADFRDIKCEIQIKTILEEAFDAKTHDLTYKPGDREVPEDLKKQFGILSSALQAIDEQSEFLKDLMLAEEKELELRREACVILYLQEAETVAVGAELSIDPDRLSVGDIPMIAGKLQSGASMGISKRFCKFAALCALRLDDEYLKDEALKYVDMFVNAAPEEANRHLVRGSMKWALGRFEGAFADTGKAVALASEKGDSGLIMQGKSNLVYFVADWKALKGREREEWKARAAEYFRELGDGAQHEKVRDTLGFYRIAFGTTWGEVESGRQMILETHGRRGEDAVYARFFRYHNYVALRRLLKLTG